MLPRMETAPARGSRDFALLLASQTFSAFGDNAVLAFILGQLTRLVLAGEMTQAALSSANAFYTPLLFIPYVLLAPLAGYVNDRFAKTRWLLGGNGIKLLGTAIAIGGINAGSDWQTPAYLLIGIGACVYSPAKYGVLPEILPAARLVKANGLMEMFTLIAILAGNVCGAFLIDHLSPLFCYNMLFVVYAAAALLNILMAASPRHPEIRLARSLGDFGRNTRALLSSPRLGRVLLGTGLFWICGAVLKMNFQPWGLTVLGFTDNLSVSLLGLWLALGIMAGSVLAGKFYRTSDVSRTRRWGWATALCVFLLTLTVSHPAVYVLLVLVGLAGGLFLIPLNAALQAESDPAALGKTIATQNFVENSAMLLSGGLVWVAVQAGAGPLAIFAILALGFAGAVTLLRVPPLPAPK